MRSRVLCQAFAFVIDMHAARPEYTSRHNTGVAEPGGGGGEGGGGQVHHRVGEYM